MIIQDTIANSDILPVRISSHDAPRVVSQASEHISSLAQPSPQQVKIAVDTINRAMQQSNQSMQISVDFATRKPVVRLTDTATGELIRQIPSKEILAIARSIDEFLEFQRGLLLNQEA
ncbi:MAG: flagellar protein FlaG [Candidatus Nitrotoga sp.]